MLTLHRTSIRVGLVTFLVSFFMLITGTAVHAKESEVCSYYKGGSAAAQNRIRLCVWVKFEIRGGEKIAVSQGSILFEKNATSAVSCYSEIGINLRLNSHYWHTEPWLDGEECNNALKSRGIKFDLHGAATGTAATAAQGTGCLNLKFASGARWRRCWVSTGWVIPSPESSDLWLRRSGRTAVGGEAGASHRSRLSEAGIKPEE
jgi:hypothetical protein